LIEIHKEVFKHHNKKSSSEHPIKRRVNTAKNKKRLSQIKKMKQLFTQNKGGLSKLTLNRVEKDNNIEETEKVVREEDWESD
jgi:hypothetical protein